MEAQSPSPAMQARRKEFEALAMPLASLLYAVACRIMGNATQAEDVVQTTFLLAWKNFDRFHPGTNFRAWIFKVMRFHMHNEFRSAKSKEVTADFSDEVNPVKASKDSVDYEATDWEAVYPDLVEDRFKNALDAMDPDQRSVLMLITLGELTYQETAEIMGVPIGTIMSRLHRARKFLQVELHELARERGLLKEADEPSEQKGQSR